MEQERRKKNSAVVKKVKTRLGERFDEFKQLSSYYQRDVLPATEFVNKALETLGGDMQLLLELVELLPDPDKREAVIKCSASLAQPSKRDPAPRVSWPATSPSPDKGSWDKSPVLDLRESRSTSASPRINVVWFKPTDMRVHDHLPMARAHGYGDGGTHGEPLPVLHLFVFDPFWFKKLPLTGLAKTGPIRARFWMESVHDLRESLRRRGQELIIRRQPTEQAMRDISTQFRIANVYAYNEVCSEELSMEERVRGVVEAGGGALSVLQGFTLYHLEDLPFDPLRSFPQTYSAFRRAVEQGCRVRAVGEEWPKYRKTGHSIVSEKGRGSLQGTCEPLCPAPTGVEVGNIPTYQELGLEEPAPLDDRADHIWRGGETSALAYLNDYFWKRDLLRRYVGATNTMTEGKIAIGKEATTKLSPWLAHGNLSPRLLYQEIENYEKRRLKNKCTYWLKHELIWRDFIRFGAMAWGDNIFKIGGIGRQMANWRWSRDQAKFSRWTTGQTGFPFNDCFMRELVATGYTTHCGRECVAWFLVRDLGLDWRMGGEWFEHTLIDYEPAANWGNWAYRIAPTATKWGPREGDVTQSIEMLLWAHKHDPEARPEQIATTLCDGSQLRVYSLVLNAKPARHVKMWLPELEPLPAKVALEPWRMSVRELSPIFSVEWSCEQCTYINSSDRTECELCNDSRPLSYCGFNYGKDYPMPIVEPKITKDKSPS
ncbi:hypothetical protein CYMTET_18506 [Cymbomonas tetramitiformis]|uniref:Cryptochrome DASH n=1 Tax=Cymbomonas tetramitiformis TaxID=36881 RepID=A0AAE0L5V1_9CHLO|nr:hypothetical protein CYMTET_18506 [Cymbomonas tetramitiformis]